MSSLETLIRSASAGPAIEFRERVYADVERQGFVREILALANALVDGPRYLIMGVRDDGSGERQIVGVTDQELLDARELYSSLVARYIEPALNIDLRAVELDGSQVLILALSAVEDPPYLLKENLSNSMREGNGWIRRSTAAVRLKRADLEQLFLKTALSPANHPTIQLGFEGNGLVEEITLAALDLNELPSRVAGEKFRNLIEAKHASQEATGRSATRIERLVHAREFGGTQPYRPISEDSLIRRATAAAEEYGDADAHYEYELRAHKVNLAISNVGDVAMGSGLLTLDFPRVDGFGISKFICPNPGSGEERPLGYPNVDIGPNGIRVQAKIESVPGSSVIAAFTQPLRIWVRAEMVGKTVPVSYSLHAANARQPVVGALRIHCGEF
jgi:hypothetical protein